MKKRKISMVGVRKSILLVLSLMIILALAPKVNSITEISPENELSIVNNQPLMSWTDAEKAIDNYKLIMSQNSDFSEANEIITTNPYYQLQQTLSEGTWYWKIIGQKTNETINQTTNETTTKIENVETSEQFSFNIITPPRYEITPDLSRYEENKRVDFKIDAPFGIKLELYILKTDFSLPYITEDLQTDTFTTFLDPGIYSLTATFTQEGIISIYDRDFVINEIETTTTEEETTQENNLFNLTLNITEENGTGIEDVTVMIETEKEDWEKTTDENGLILLENLEEAKYNILIDQEGYELYSKKKTFDEERIYNIKLTTLDEPEESNSETEEEIIRPEVKITSPKQGEKLNEPIILEFTTTNKEKIKSCDVMIQKENQKGWEILYTINEQKEENEYELTDLQYGKLKLKLKCTSTENIIFSSETIIFENEEQIEPNHLIKDYLIKMNDFESQLPTGENIMMKSLNIFGEYSKAEEELKTLQEQFDEHIKQGDKAGGEIIEGKIVDKKSELDKELIKEIKITTQKDEVQLFDGEKQKEMIEYYIQTQDLTDKQKKLIKEKIIEDQEQYTTRTKITNIEITTIDGSKKYLTGITNTLQRFDTEKETPETIKIIDYLPKELMQVSGKPEIMDESGTTTGTITDDYALLDLKPNTAYSYVFTGNINTKQIEEIAPLVIEPYDLESIKKQKTGLQKISGNVTTTLNDNGISVSAIMLGMMLAIIVFGIFKNPIYNYGDYRYNKKVNSFTKNVHLAMDSLEIKNNEKAIKIFPTILETYDLLKQKDKEEVNHIMNYFGNSLNTHSANKHMTEVAIMLTKVKTKEELTNVVQEAWKTLTNLKDLSEEGKQELAPRIRRFKELILEKEKEFSGWNSEN